MMGKWDMGEKDHVTSNGGQSYDATVQRTTMYQRMTLSFTNRFYLISYSYSRDYICTDSKV